MKKLLTSILGPILIGLILAGCAPQYRYSTPQPPKTFEQKQMACQAAQNQMQTYCGICNNGSSAVKITECFKCGASEAKINQYCY
jgi:hypothetical protein